MQNVGVGIGPLPATAITSVRVIGVDTELSCVSDVSNILDYRQKLVAFFYF